MAKYFQPRRFEPDISTVVVEEFITKVENNNDHIDSHLVDSREDG